MGWNRLGDEVTTCFFEDVMAPQFLVFLYFATIICPATIMAAFYTHIYTVVLKQTCPDLLHDPENHSLCLDHSTSLLASIGLIMSLRQMVTVNGAGAGGTQGSMLRVLGAARKREVKATQNLSIIVLFFMVCWIPLYTINFFQAYYPPWHAPYSLTMSCIILSHLNSAGNPLLYAYHLRDFRAALRSLLFGLPLEKSVGRDNTVYQETRTEQRERLKRVNSLSSLYAGAVAGPVVRGHKRSMTLPLYQPSPTPVYQIPTRLDLSCILENSHSEESKSMSILGLHSLGRIKDLPFSPKKDSTELRAGLQESPLAFMDEKTQEIYGLGLIESTEVNQLFVQSSESDLTQSSEIREPKNTQSNKETQSPALTGAT